MPRKKKRNLIKELQTLFDMGTKFLTRFDGVITPLIKMIEEGQVVERAEGVRLIQKEKELAPYEILGVPRDADRETVTRAYRKLMHHYHSDRGSGSDAMAKSINVAYEKIRKERGWK